MRIINTICMSALIGAGLSGQAYAAGEMGDLDVTIRVIDSKQDIREFINRIELPKGIAETAPAAPAQPQEANGDASKTSRQVDGDGESGRRSRDTDKHRDERRNSDKPERNGKEPSNSQIGPSATDRSWISEQKRKDPGELRNHAPDSREYRETMRSNTREQRTSPLDTPREN